ncbi:Hypothetical protein NTJ_10673 [Nesidiocoris tenuis]|uniref:Ataxin 2 SM domain-containing protein n=1 Tax=Nesidiocoris tenuis TaxID=355587 RepID=A0ABN7B2Q4_9HEMI|nr:Hypothetical protein NTJ_10673 [Nesidiocoris tenuis]
MPQKKSENGVENEFDTETQEPILSEDIFKRSDFAKTLSSLVGQKVKVKTRKGAILDGYLAEFSPETGIVLARQKIEGNDADVNLKPGDIASVSCVNINVEEAALNLSRQRFESYARFGNCKSENGDDFWSEDKWNGELLDQPPEQKDEEAEDEDVQPTGTGGLYSGNTPSEERISTLNPYAEPFIPCGVIDDAVNVAPSYVAAPNKLTDESEENVDDFIAPRMRNRYLNEDADDGLLTSLAMDAAMSEGKMYHPEKNQYPLYHMSPQDCQQYYPQLQYIQYFRRFY